MFSKPCVQTLKLTDFLSLESNESGSLKRNTKSMSSLHQMASHNGGKKHAEGWKEQVVVYI